jgi:tetratricopeptide (TPR) repeat protein
MHRLIVFFIFSLPCSLAFSASSIEDLKSLIDSENYAVAAETGEQLLIKHPGHARIQFLTAYAYQYNRQNWKAAYHYKKLILQHPELPEPRNNLAMIYIADGEYEKASQILIDAINTSKSYAIAYQNLNRIYAGMASEAYQRALTESGETPIQRPKIQLTALSKLESIEQRITTSTPRTQNSLIDIANFETVLIEQVINWAKAWGNKDVDTYVSYYSSEYKPEFATHSDWVEYRRQRIMQAEFIKIGLGKIQIRAQSDNRAIIEFEQSYDSPGYTDRVIKRLALSRIGSQWKITDEQVISIL